MSIKVEQNKKKEYQKKFAQYGTDARSMQWKSIGAAHQRFRQMWAEIDFNDKSVLDVGCGMGEMARFLNKRYEGVEYTGVDIVPEFIKAAQERFPQNTFIERDYLNDPLPQKFDVVLASGIINNNTENNMEYRQNAIETMFRHTKKVFAFNMLGSYPQPETPEGSNVWYADSIEILKYCFTLTPRVILRHHYHPRDFTIFMYTSKVK